MRLRVAGRTLPIKTGVTAFVSADEPGRRRLRRALLLATHGRWDRLLLDERTSRVQSVEGPAVVVICADRMQGVSRLADRVVMLEPAGVRFNGSLEEFCTRPDGSRDEPDAAFLRRLFAAGA